jgi:hypothetical protein
VTERRQPIDTSASRRGRSLPRRRRSPGRALNALLLLALFIALALAALLVVATGASDVR